MKKGYKDTLLLPNTKFPMQANLVNREKELVNFWIQDKTYKKMSSKNKDKFILHDGPPYANGDIHVGHALNKILKDIIVKQKNMSGFSCEFIPGWDCHGLPIELKTEEEIKKKKVNLNNDSEFRDYCSKYAKNYVEIQKQSFKNLLILADWENSYKTLDKNYQAQVILNLGILLERGYLKKGYKPVYWSWAAQTALAESEVVYPEDSEGKPEHISPSCYLKFKLKNHNLDKDTFLVVWTTTPWTLFSNVAIAYIPNDTYSIVEHNNEFLIMHSKLISSVEKNCKKNFNFISEFNSSDLFKNLIYENPLVNRESILIEGYHVNSEAGTGLVHIAPGHGIDDFNVGLKNKLPIICPVDKYGRFTEEVKQFEGKNVLSSNKDIMELLEDKGLLLNDKSQTIKHKYPYCWRTNKPIIFRTTEQWFISIDHEDLRNNSIKEINKVKWVPDWGKNRIRNMIDNRPDWCITRQRRWGIPLPIAYCKSCKEPLLNKIVSEKLSKEVKEKGINVWWEDSFQLNDINCPYCNSKLGLEKEKDIVDVWVDSGFSFSANNIDQADLYLEGNDQYRGWFHSSLLLSTAIQNKSPYKKILTHGFVVDGSGEKFSKSKGNFLPLSTILNKYGAEILRLWVVSEDFKSDIKFSEDIFKTLSENYRKIRNTWRFILSVIEDFDYDKDQIQDLPELHKFIRNKLSFFSKNIKNYYEEYNFTNIIQETNKFFNIDLSSFYFEICKDYLYNRSKDSIERRSCQTVLYEILNITVKLLAPIFSFTCEEIWQYLKRPNSIFLESLEEEKEENINERDWDKILTLNQEIKRKLEFLRKDKKITTSLDAKVTLPHKDLLENYPLPEIFLVSEVLGGEKFKVEISELHKCDRCLIRKKDINEQQLCSSCCETLKG